MDTVRIVVQRTTLRVQLGSVPVSVGAGGVSDGDKGDIAVSSSGAVWTVDAVGGSSAAAIAAAVSGLATHVASSTAHGISAFGATLVDDANQAAARTTLGLVIGTDVAPYDAGLASLAAVDTGADLVPYTTGAGAWAGATLTAAARGLLDDATVAAMRATLGLSDPAVMGQVYVLPGDVSNSSATTFVAATGMSFTPVANRKYAIAVVATFAAAATTTGISAVVADSATAFDGTGAQLVLTRGSSFSALASADGSVVAGNAPSGLAAGGTSSGSGLTLVWGVATWQADATPQDVSLYFASEVAGSAVTLKAGLCFLVVMELST